MDLCCNCLWFAEKDRNDECSHSLAVEHRHGCCLVQDLFTNNEDLEVSPDTKACSSFKEDK